LKLPKDYKPNSTLVLNVIGTSNAGDTKSISLNEGECVKINTGAYVPESANAVIQIEDTIALEKNTIGEDTQIKIDNSNIKIEQDIRAIGSDIALDEIIIRDKSFIGPAQIGCCATVGALKLKVFKKPIVGILSTGNELLDPSTETLEHGKIRDSNKSLLNFACKQKGIDQVIDLGVANDNPDSVMEKFKDGLEKADLIISTGGVSMSDKDMVKDVLVKDLNCSLHFARLNMKPGKPTTFMTVEYKGKKKLLFCLPGNPVSAIVTFNLLVVPSLRRLMGYENPNHTRITVQVC
jgi:gephyrin